MVTYREWTQIAFDVAKARGFDPARPAGQRTLAGGRSFTEDNPNAQAVKVFASIWNDHKEELQQSSHAEARALARDLIEIR